MTCVKLAIVEDDSLFRDLLCGAMKDLPAIEIVGAFGDAQEAGARIPELKPDVVLLDINLGSGGNGVRLGLALQTALPGIGIVLLSNHREPSYLSAIPADQVSGWSYLLKSSVRDLAALSRAVVGAASGFVVLDPGIAAGLAGRAESGLSLTERGRQLLSLVAQGYSNAAIAEELCLSERTIENQLGAIYRQLDIDTTDSRRHSRVQAALAFLRQEAR